MFGIISLLSIVKWRLKPTSLVMASSSISLEFGAYQSHLARHDVTKLLEMFFLPYHLLTFNFEEDIDYQRDCAEACMKNILDYFSYCGIGYVHVSCIGKNSLHIAFSSKQESIRIPMTRVNGSYLGPNDRLIAVKVPVSRISSREECRNGTTFVNHDLMRNADSLSYLRLRHLRKAVFTVNLEVTMFILAAKVQTLLMSWDRI
ncbi:hypothetical protein Tco_1438019 [Tanacetum coccineum]